MTRRVEIDAETLRRLLLTGSLMACHLDRYADEHQPLSSEHTLPKLWNETAAKIERIADERTGRLS